MKANNDFSLLNDRLDSIEKILRILVVNSITDNVVNNVLSESNEITAESPSSNAIPTERPSRNGIATEQPSPNGISNEPPSRNEIPEERVSQTTHE